MVGAMIFQQKLRISPDTAFSINDWTAFVIFITVIGGVGRLMNTTGAVPAPDMPGGILTAVRTWVNSGPGSNFYQDIEMRVRDREATDGAMLIRHRYEYGSEPAA